MQNNRAGSSFEDPALLCPQKIVYQRCLLLNNGSKQFNDLIDGLDCFADRGGHLVNVLNCFISRFLRLFHRLDCRLVDLSIGVDFPIDDFFPEKKENLLKLGLLGRVSDVAPQFVQLIPPDSCWAILHQITFSQTDLLKDQKGKNLRKERGKTTSNQSP